MQTYSDMVQTYTHKVAKYDWAQCEFAMNDCYEALSLHPEQTPYTQKLYCEIDALRERVATLNKRRAH